MKTRKSERIAREQKLMDGAEKHLQPVVVLGKTYASPEIIAMLKARADKTTAVEQTRAILRKQVQDERAELAATNGVVVALRRALLNQYADDPTVITDFGLTPPKVPRARTAEEKLLAAARANATRKARGTLGKRQKAGIKGHVDTLTVTVHGAVPAAPGAAPKA